jgi:PKD repeat protein
VVFSHFVQTDPQGYYDDTFILQSDASVGEYTVVVEEEKYEVTSATTFEVFSSVIEVDAHGPYEGIVGQPVQFSGDATGGRTPYFWYWDFDDDTNATVQNPTHSYQSAGVYTALLTVNDSYHHNGTDIAVVTISEPPQGNHTVFIEEGTATWCSNCPSVADILHELYTSGDYNFYYVAMIEDKNTKAHDRLYNDYNILGFPTVFIDGGYQVVMGEKMQSVFESAIQNATARETPALEITLTSQWNQNTTRLETTVLIHNAGDASYNGLLRVYLTEIVSRWNDYDGNAYHYGFLDYLLNEEITIAAGDTITRSNSTDGADLDPENLMVIATVFNATAHDGYANPPSENPFNAYYVDATDGVRISEGNLPPEIGISNPKSGRLHLMGKPIVATPNLKTILLGRTNITVQATDDSSVTKVEFYIDDKKVAESTSAPYEWIWKTPTWLKWKHTIKVVAYDDEGKTSTATMDVSALILF